MKKCSICKIELNEEFFQKDSSKADGEPDTLEFDMHFVKNQDGTLKILVDITYGDSMVSEFSVQQPNKVDVMEYFLSSNECATEELFEKYGIYIPKSEEFYYWYIPNTLSDVIEWVKSECKLPFQIVQRAPYNQSLRTNKPTLGKENVVENLHKNIYQNIYPKSEYNYKIFPWKKRKY